MKDHITNIIMLEIFGIIIPLYFIKLHCRTKDIYVEDRLCYSVIYFGITSNRRCYLKSIYWRKDQHLTTNIKLWKYQNNTLTKHKAR